MTTNSSRVGFTVSLIATTTAFALGATSNVFAQGAADSDSGGLEEVIVSARKREERLQDVPSAVAAFSGTTLAKLQVVSVDELSKLTTGLTFDSDFGRLSDRPILRGQASILGASGVAYFIDGVYYTGSLLDFNLDDVASLQVIKGPQSALFGRNTYSGAIVITTLAPTRELTRSAKIEYAQFGQTRVSAKISGPFIDDVFGASLALGYYERTGVTGKLWKNKFDGQEMGDQKSEYLNFGTYWTPNDRLDVRTRLYWTDQDDGPPPLFLQGYQSNNVLPDNSNRRANVIGDQGAPVATGAGSVYIGANRYYAGEIQARQLDVDGSRSLGVKPEISDRRLLAAITANFKFTENLTGTYVGGYNRNTGKNAYDFDYQSTSYGPFMTSSVGLRPRVGSPVGVYEYAVSTGAPAANFAAIGGSKGRDMSHELQLRFQRDGLNLLLGGYYYKSHSDSFNKQNPVAGWGDQLVQSLGVLQGRMQAACSSFFQNRAGFANCTSIVRRATATNAAIVPFDSTSGVWTTFEDTNMHSRLENRAVFAAVTYKAMDRLELGAELRSAREVLEALPGQSRSTATLTDLSETKPFSSLTDLLYQKATFNSVTPRVTARFDVTPNNHVYAVIADGTKPGGINNFRASQIGFGQFNEEEARSYELGTKNTFLNDRLRVNASVFRNGITGQQLTDSVVYLDGVPGTVIKNVGKVRISGLELELEYLPAAIEGLNLRLNYSYIKSKIEQGLDANEGVLRDVADNGLLDCSLGLAPDYAALAARIRAANPASITPGTVICHNDTGTQYFGAYGSIVGRELPRVPEHNVNLGVDYSRPLANDWTLNTGANVSYESKKFVQVDNLAFYGEATILNANIGLSNDTYRISLWAKNLTDDESVVSASRFTDATNQSLRAFFGANRLPRQVGISATVKF